MRSRLQASMICLLSTLWQGWNLHDRRLLALIIKAILSRLLIE